MYNKITLASKYLRYLLFASNGKGHGVHSPFVYQFIEQVLNDKKNYAVYGTIEKRRRELLQDTSVIEVEDFGAGSAIIKTKQRIVKDIAASSLKNKKFAQLLYRMVAYYKPQHIIELGTSFGTTTSYLAQAQPLAQVHTFEGATAIANIAQQSIHALSNVHIHLGNIDDTLPQHLNSLNHVDFAFVDGNHQEQATINYFLLLLKKSHDQTILVFDDIHWSDGMEKAWAYITNHKAVTLSVDLFFIGIIMISKDFKVKQDFRVRF